MSLADIPPDKTLQFLKSLSTEKLLVLFQHKTSSSTYRSNYDCMLKKVKQMHTDLLTRIDADVKDGGYRQYMMCTALQKFNESGVANSELYVGEFTLERIVNDFSFCDPNVMTAEQVVFYKYMLEDMGVSWKKYISEFIESVKKRNR